MENSFANHILNLIEVHGLQVVLPHNLPASIAGAILSASFTLLAAASPDQDTRNSIAKEKVDLARCYLRMPVYALLKYHKEMGYITRISTLRMRYSQLLFAKMMVHEKINRDPNHDITFIRPTLDDIFDRKLNRKAPDNVVKLKVRNDRATSLFGECFFQ